MTTTTNNSEPLANGVLEKYTLDVEQADAHVIISPRGTTTVIDADEEQVADGLDQIFADRVTDDGTEPQTIDHFAVTHIHDDHVDGVRVLKDTGYTIDQAYQPSASRYETGKDSQVKRAVLGAYFEALSDHGIEPNEINQLTEGDPILEEEDATLTALSPPATAETVETTSQTSGHWCTFKPEEANGNGVVCKFEGPNGVSGLFMGDVGDESAHNAESWLVEQHDKSDSDVDLNTDILFLGHHGSKNSTGETFLNEVDPAHVVISSGLDNNYTSKNQYDGHPHDETLKRLHEREIDVHWTAIHGTIDTAIEEENITLDHETTIETTDAADIAVLKYYGQENDLDQEALAETEEITRSELPEETPEWVNEVSFVTEQSTIDPEKLRNSMSWKPNGKMSKKRTTGLKEPAPNASNGKPSSNRRPRPPRG